MPALTCFPCMGGRHGFRCEGRSDNSCSCNVCHETVVTAIVQRKRIRDAKNRREATAFAKTQRKVQVPKVHAPRKYPKKPGPVPGAHGLKGRSSLDPVEQVLIAQRLAEGDSISALAKAFGTSRDKIRTIKQRQEALERSKP